MLSKVVSKELSFYHLGASDIESCVVDIKEQLIQKRDIAMDRRATLEQTRERFQQTASSVLEILNLTAPMILETSQREEIGS